MDAFGSPIGAAAIIPPLIINDGLIPKKAGFHKTKSANFPASIEPTSCDIPCAIAGLMVYFEIYESALNYLNEKMVNANKQQDSKKKYR